MINENKNNEKKKNLIKIIINMPFYLLKKINIFIFIIIVILFEIVRKLLLFIFLILVLILGILFRILFLIKNKIIQLKRYCKKIIETDSLYFFIILMILSWVI
jgi:hypothetical protein